MSAIQTGLVFDIIGAILIFFFGVPSVAVTVGHKKWKDLVSKAGLLMLVIGFSMQLYGSYNGAFSAP